jgi:perosamine synthetase
VIPLSKPEIGPPEETAVLKVLRSGMLAMGEKTEELEHDWALYCGVRHAVFMANCTVALEAILHCLNVGYDAGVIMPSFSFFATLSAVWRGFGAPIFVDIGPDFCMDPNKVEDAITPRTKAILPVHLYGLPADMGPLREIAERRNLLLIEDAAQAIGASYKGFHAGALGHAAMFSLYATKNVMSGEGGMVTTNDDQLADKLRLFRHHESFGTNLRPTDLTAAIAIEQLCRYRPGLLRRRNHAAVLTLKLKGLPGVVTPTVPAGRTHVWHQYTLRVQHRDVFAQKLKERGIGTGVYYPVPIHRQQPVAFVGELPETDKAAAEVLSIPVRPNLQMTAAEIAEVTA